MMSKKSCVTLCDLTPSTDGPLAFWLIIGDHRIQLAVGEVLGLKRTKKNSYMYHTPIKNQKKMCIV
jgi:hypothetical protein